MITDLPPKLIRNFEGSCEVPRNALCDLFAGANNVKLNVKLCLIDDRNNCPYPVQKVSGQCEERMPACRDPCGTNRRQFNVMGKGASKEMNCPCANDLNHMMKCLEGRENSDLFLCECNKEDSLGNSNSLCRECEGLKEFLSTCEQREQENFIRRCNAELKVCRWDEIPCNVKPDLPDEPVCKAICNGSERNNTPVCRRNQREKCKTDQFEDNCNYQRPNPKICQCNERNHCMIPNKGDEIPTCRCPGKIEPEPDLKEGTNLNKLCLNANTLCEGDKYKGLNNEINKCKEFSCKNFNKIKHLSAEIVSIQHTVNAMSDKFNDVMDKYCEMSKVLCKEFSELKKNMNGCNCQNDIRSKASGTGMNDNVSISPKEPILKGDADNKSELSKSTQTDDKNRVCILKNASTGMSKINNESSTTKIQHLEKRIQTLELETKCQCKHTLAESNKSVGAKNDQKEKNDQEGKSKRDDKSDVTMKSKSGIKN